MRINKTLPGTLQVSVDNHELALTVTRTTLTLEPLTEDLIHATLEIHHIIGLITLHNKYLAAVTRKEYAGQIGNSIVWRVKRCVLIPIGEAEQLEFASVGSKDPKVRDIEAFLSAGRVYYIDPKSDYPLELSLQHQILLDANSDNKGYIDDRYNFNKSLIDPILQLSTEHGGKFKHSDVSPFILKVIVGFVSTVELHIPTNVDPNDIQSYNITDFIYSNKSNKFEKVSYDTSPTNHVQSFKKPSDVNESSNEKTKKEDESEPLISIESKDYVSVKATLIARLNRKRVGSRYVRRGIDKEGNAANNVEMEHIVFPADYKTGDKLVSFCELRGSVPTVWGQDLTLKYCPDMILPDFEEPKTWNCVKKHYDDLLLQYKSDSNIVPGSVDGPVVCVNLLNSDGFEAPLTKTYENSIIKHGDSRLEYELFSLNRVCKKMNFKNISILIKAMRKRLDESEYLIAKQTEDGKFIVDGKLQTGVTRVSCLDSLDRTNLTCSKFAYYQFPKMVHELYPQAKFQDFGDEPQIKSRALTNIWADAGDSVSKLYAGTGALKADVTRTGKRDVIWGPLTDGINSLTRYYLNNFADGKKQDTFDLITGKATEESIQKLIDEELKLVKKNDESSNCAINEFESVPFSGFRSVFPKDIQNLWDLIIGLIMFLILSLLIKIKRVSGASYIDRPILSQEWKDIKQY